MFFMKMITFKLLRRNLWAVLLAVFSFCTFQAAAGVPRKMAYQIMALNPTTGQILANRDVNIRIELRQDKTDGQAVWHQDFEARTDEAGICQLTLEFADDIDWASADYYLATLIDGHECGTSQMMSVPYALQAATIEGVITKKELVGTWKAVSYENIYNYTFNEDGSGYKSRAYNGESAGGESFKWTLDNVGHLLVMEEGSNRNYNFTYSVLKLSDTSISFDQYLFQKQ